MFKYLSYIIIILILLSKQSLAEKVIIFEFTNKEFSELKIRKVRGAEAKTIYSLGQNENGKYLRAEANNSASGLGKEIKIDLDKTPFLNITWKVEKDLRGILENTKKGHDYAARVFVVKKTGATPLSNRAMNYVFSSNKDINTYHPSPFTKKSIDYTLSSTKENFNEWVTVKVNVKEHFMKFHNLDLNEINGVAIMSDTDNSKLSSLAYYQNIFFSSK